MCEITSQNLPSSCKANIGLRTEEIGRQKQEINRNYLVTLIVTIAFPNEDTMGIVCRATTEWSSGPRNDEAHAAM
jgi:hypothetical protein